MKIIGLCGGSGSGKTTATEIFASLGAAVIDTDLVWHELCRPGSDCVRELADEFGHDIIDGDGGLDRLALGAIVFADSVKRARLNAISHALIKDETVRRLHMYESSGYDAAVVDAPLLFESGFDKLCCVTVGVVTDRETRIARIIARDGIDKARAEARIAAQITDEELRRRCDYIIVNDGDKNALYERVESLYKQIVGVGIN